MSEPTKGVRYGDHTPGECIYDGCKLCLRPCGPECHTGAIPNHRVGCPNDPTQQSYVSWPVKK